MEHVSTLPKAITFNQTEGISISLLFRKLDIQNFPGILRSTKSKFREGLQICGQSQVEKKDEIADVSIPDLAHKKWPLSLEKHTKPLLNP